MSNPSGPGAAACNRRAIPGDACESLWRAADGHAIRRFDWSASPDRAEARGSLLFLPGRGDFFEKWLDAIGHWHAQGWSISAIDWRGQAGSGRLTADGSTGHIADYQVWIDDLAAFWRDWSDETAGPHVLVAHSMGGHVALRALAQQCISPEAVVLSAPMLGLRPERVPRGMLQAFARAMTALRGATQPAWKGAERPDAAHADRFALLTHDEARYADEAWWRQQRPELALGPPSWGWIERSLASIAQIEKAGALEAIDVPVLILATSKDRLVSWRAIHEAAARLPRARLVVYGEEARHEILRESDAVRSAALAEIDAFLDAQAPARA